MAYLLPHVADDPERKSRNQREKQDGRQDGGRLSGSCSPVRRHEEDYPPRGRRRLATSPDGATIGRVAGIRALIALREADRRNGIDPDSIPRTPSDPAPPAPPGIRELMDPPPWSENYREPIDTEALEDVESAEPTPTAEDAAPEPGSTPNLAKAKAIVAEIRKLVGRRDTPTGNPSERPRFPKPDWTQETDT